MAVAFILKGYPRLSESFIAQEIRGLEKRGMDIRIVSLRHPTDGSVHPVHREIVAPVRYLPEYLHDAPRRVLKGWRTARRLAGYAEARRTWLKDLVRDPTRNRVRRFGQACVLAAELPADVTWLHAHFLHTPASVARYAAIMTGLPWSVSAHAKDIWTTPEWELSEKLDQMRWLVTCTGVGAAHLRGLAADESKVHLAYHGLDLARFAPPPDRFRRRDGSDPADPVVIVSVGRAVPKKGYDDLLDALSRLPSTLNWRFVHIGGGDLLPKLKKTAVRLGLADRIIWRGAQPHETVLQELRQADLFAMMPKIGKDGDRDGLPNVLMEAGSQRLPVLATDVSAVGELIVDGSSGLLVQSGDVDAAARALGRLIVEPDLRARLGEAGEKAVRSQFSFDTCLDDVAARFGLNKETLAA